MGKSVPELKETNLIRHIWQTSKEGETSKKEHKQSKKHGPDMKKKKHKLDEVCTRGKSLLESWSTTYLAD